MKNYWKSLEEQQGLSPRILEEKYEDEHKSAVQELLQEDLGQSATSRRNFLKLAGFSVATAAIAASCENPVKKAIPYLNQPHEVVPGKANYYASTYFDGNDYCPVVVKVRDGRPIKLEGNELSGITGGGTNARVQAGVISLYDGRARRRAPKAGGEEVEWKVVDDVIRQELGRISAEGGRMVLLTSSIISPSTQRLLDEFTAQYPGFEVVQYDPVSYTGMLAANEASFGTYALPTYRFDKAELILSFGADFLGTWVSPVEFAHQYTTGRDLSNGSGKMSRHIQVEAGMSLTGSNADQRIVAKPSDVEGAIISLYNALARKTGKASVKEAATTVDTASLADELMKHPGKAVVVASTNDPGLQVLINGINEMAGSYGNTILTGPWDRTHLGDDRKMSALVADMNAGQVKALFINNLNPLYSWPQAEAFRSGMEKTGISLSFSSVIDETGEAARYACPVHHFLESWDDAQPRDGYYSLQQPCINPLFSTRSMQDSLLTWMGKDVVYRDYIKETWQSVCFSKQSNHLLFNDFWNHSLQAGVFEPGTEGGSPAAFDWMALDKHSPSPLTPSEIEVELFESIAIGDGRHANNPWLQELPDPVTKVTWDNFAAVSPAFAATKGLKDGDYIKLNDTLEVPVLLQPGQADGTFSVALGYGRTVAGKIGNNVGVNAWPMVNEAYGALRFSGAVSGMATTGKNLEFARTQSHHNMEGRDIVRETTLDRYLENPASGNEMHAVNEKHHVSLYKQREHPGHHWGLAIDLSKCIGCSACAIACQAENNIPVIGKEEVRRRRIMHWIRIDRYYTGEGANPDVVYQPLMCQHCDNAPCENVCPVAATTHSTEGLNQMSYNRCIGTRYCINNCPYKVRRFNWFRYTDNEKFDQGNLDTEMGRLVLNPDVTVRERGVVEKCSFCVQRIQEVKLDAKNEGRPVRDGEVTPACVQACPAKALVFGDLNDPESQITRMFRDERNYHLLEQLHTLPNVGYLTKVRHREGGPLAAQDAAHAEHSH
jgi:molybdopterin-containing oxidoreductase family iron-sulfur binding subunit